MSMYEFIIDILEKNGPESFSSICDKMNQVHPANYERDKPIQLSHIKSVVSRKKDLFAVEDDIVSIRQEKEFVSLSVRIGGYAGPSYKIEVDFVHNRFYIIECYIDCTASSEKQRTVHPGNVEQFKKEIYRLKLWNWDRDYQQDTLVLDGTAWWVKLKTKGMVYESEGLQSFPKEWPKFSKAVSRLIGINIK